MSQDFVTQLRLQLREAALREERRSPVAWRVVGARRRLPGPAPVLVALALAMIAAAVGIGAMTLRGEPQPAQAKVVATFRVAPPGNSLPRDRDLVGRRATRLAVGFGAVWTTAPPFGPQPGAQHELRDHVLRIDPGARDVAGRLPVRPDALVRTGAGEVWVLTGELLYPGDHDTARLLRIDPATSRTLGRMPVEAPSGAALGTVDLQFDDGFLWVVGTYGARRIDLATHEYDRFFALLDRGSSAIRGVVIEADRLWMLTTDDQLREYETVRGQLLSSRRVEAPGAAHLFPGRPGTLNLIGSDRVAVLERASGRTLWERTLEGQLRHWTADGDTLWLHVSRAPAAPDRLVQLDAESGRRLAQVDLPRTGAAGVAKVGDEVWVATPGGEIVVVEP